MNTLKDLSNGVMSDAPRPSPSIADIWRAVADFVQHTTPGSGAASVAASVRAQARTLDEHPVDKILGVVPAAPRERRVHLMRVNELETAVSEETRLAVLQLLRDHGVTLSLAHTPIQVFPTRVVTDSRSTPMKSEGGENLDTGAALDWHWLAFNPAGEPTRATLNMAGAPGVLAAIQSFASNMLLHPDGIEPQTGLRIDPLCRCGHTLSKHRKAPGSERTGCWGKLHGCACIDFVVDKPLPKITRTHFRDDLEACDVAANGAPDDRPTGKLPADEAPPRATGGIAAGLEALSRPGMADTLRDVLVEATLGVIADALQPMLREPDPPEPTPVASLSKAVAGLGAVTRGVQGKPKPAPHVAKNPPAWNADTYFPPPSAPMVIRCFVLVSQRATRWVTAKEVAEALSIRNVHGIANVGRALRRLRKDGKIASKVLDFGEVGWGPVDKHKRRGW